MSYLTLAPSTTEAAVQVAVRIRPINSGASAGPSAPVCHVDSRLPRMVVLEPPSARSTRGRSIHSTATAADVAGDERHFTFDFVYDDNDSSSSPSTSHYQERVYADFGRQIVHEATAGYNCTLLAYGQTSSGKSYSMMGTADGDHAGLIPRICAALFDHISHSPPTTPSGDAVLRKLEVSYIEIYSEKVRDLLDPNKRNLKVRENPKTGPYVEGVSCCAVSDYAELSALMATGNLERTIASTNMNSESSRSHAVFTLQLTTTTIDDSTQLSSDVVSKVQLVDLAGSERVETSGATGIRLKEASQINKSLTTLGRVVQALAARSEASGAALRGSGLTPYPTMRARSLSTLKKEEAFIPFRDSVLTWLLKESLGGNSRTFMLATVSPCEVNLDETLSTLRYASRAKRIVNQARVNEDPNAELIRSLKAEVEALRARLAQSEATSPAVFPQTAPLPPSIRYTPASIPWSGASTGNFDSVREKDAELLEMNAHIARLQSELAQNSVSFVEMEQQWQSKLRQARELEEARLREIQERGVSVVEVKDLPFLVNLNEDPALTESLIYHLQEGRTTVGSRKRSSAPLTRTRSRLSSASTSSPLASSSSPDSSDDEGEGGVHGADRRIVLSGLHVKEDHCLITKHANGVVISPIKGVSAETHINGELLTEERALVHGDRVVVGQHHFFRFSRSKQQIEEDRGKERERRRKRREDRKSHMSITTLSVNSPASALSPSHSPLSADGPDPTRFDFDFAQRELIVGGKNAAKPPPNGRPPAILNRSLNRSHIEDHEPDSSPEPQGRQGSAPVFAEMVEAPSIFISPPVRPLSAGSARSTSAVSPSAESPSPSCVKVTHQGGEEKEAEGESLQAPTFHLGRDVKGSIDWSSRRALTRGEIDEWIRQDRRYLAREKQRLIDRAHANCVQLMQPLTHFTAAEFRLTNHAVYRWRWHVIKRAVQEEVMRLVFLCDEANAISAALGRVERYKVELASSHCVLPEIFLSSLPFTTAFSQPQGSPLQRLRQMKVVLCQVVEVRRRMLPIPLLTFDFPTFQEQLAALRDLYNDMIEGADEAASRATTATPSTPSSSLPSPSPPPSLSLPSSELYQHPQLLGRALCFLHGLRYGQSIKHSATVLDERGEVAGVLGIEMEIASVDEDVARREISAEEKARMREEREDEARRRLRDSLIDPTHEAKDNTDDPHPPPSPLSPPTDESKSESFLQAHRTLAIIVRLTSYDSQARNLRRVGLQSVWVKYHVQDNTTPYRTRKLSVVDDVNRFTLDYQRTHYFSGMELQMLVNWMKFDALIFELWCRVEEPSKLSKPSPQLTRFPSLPALSTQSSVDEEADGEAADAGRRESLARRMHSPAGRMAGEWREGEEKSVTSRGVGGGHHVRRSTVGQPIGGVGGGVVGSKVVEDVRVEVENGTKLVDHVLFACVDVEEEVVGKKGTFAPCSLKVEDDGKAICRINVGRERRLVVSLLQADHRPCVLESLRAITATCLTLRTATTRSSPVLPEPITFPILEHFAKQDHKLIICTTAWPSHFTSHPLFNQSSVAGERVQVQLKLECYISETTAPVEVPVTVEVKVYRGGEKAGGLFRAKAALTGSSTEGERLARLGTHFTFTRHSSPQTVGHVLHEHSIQLEQLQRRILHELHIQHHRLITQLTHTATPHFVEECREAIDRGADGLCRRFTLRLSRVVTDLRTRGGIRVEVVGVTEESGIKCGYLNERRKGGEWDPKWCVLRPPYLFIYAKRGERREQAIVKLMKAEYSRGALKWTFCIKTSAGSTFTMQAASEVEMQSWMKSLGAGIGNSSSASL